jgi:hypothetical protein
MHFQTALVIPILAIGALAIYPIEGSESGLDYDLKAVPLVVGVRVMNDVYTNCAEKTETDGQDIKGEECFAHALQYMIQILSDAYSSNQFVALLSNVVSGVGLDNGTAATSVSSLDSAPSLSTAVPSKSKRENENAMDAVLNGLNDHIRRRSEGGQRAHAVHIGRSDIHPTDGFAIRTNVHSGDATLHVHTNGSHATASFKKDDFSPLGRRNDEWAAGSRFRFEGAQGLKVQLIADDQQDYGALDTLLMKLAYGERQMAPKLKESDSWGLALCRTSDHKRTLLGKLVAEDNGAGYDWETEFGVDMDCAA